MAIQDINTETLVGLVQHGEWDTLANGDVGEAYDSARYSDKTVQVFGTFGGATVTLQGSSDPRVETDLANAIWVTLTDTTETALALTSAGGASILQNYRWIRPSVAGGGGTTAIKVIVTAKGK
jgi:hypothetical protein